MPFNGMGCGADGARERIGKIHEEGSMSDVIPCKRCNQSGEIGKKTRGDREAPGPVPDDARGWFAATCPDCNGMGMIEVDNDQDAA